MSSKTGESGRGAPVWKRPPVIAAVIAFVFTWSLLPGVTRLVSRQPLPGDCGKKHDGLVIGTDLDVSPGFQRRKLVDGWNGQLQKWNRGKSRAERATLVEVSRTTDETRSQLAAALDSGSCAYDVILADVVWIPEYIKRGFLTKVDNSWMPGRSDFFDPVLATGQSHDRVQYAVPWFTDAGLLYMRRGAQGPGSWDDLLSGGYLTQLKNYEALTVNALEVIWNTQKKQVLSGPINGVDENTARVVLQGLGRLASARPRLAQSLTYTEDDSLNTFIDSLNTSADQPHLPMRNWPYAFRVLTANPRVRDAFDVQQLPGTSVLGGWDLAVSAHSRKKAEAGALIKFLTRSDNEHQMFVCGGFTPTRRSAFADPRPCPDRSFRKEELPTPTQFGKFADTVQAAVLRAGTRPVTPYYAQFSETFRDCAVQVLDHHPPAPKALATALTDALHGRSGGCRDTA